MSTNKNAMIRYQALDSCFRDTRRKYYIDDLVEACREAVYDYSGSRKLSKRTVQEDISFMESNLNWNIELERHKDGKKIYYRYQNPDFSITKQPLTELEKDQLAETLAILGRFRGMPQFDWWKI